MASLLREYVPIAPRRILDIGSGDGRFTLAVAQLHASRWAGVEIVMVDRIGLIGEDLKKAFTRLGWQARPIVADIFDPREKALRGSFDLVCANLILHHFDDVQLVALFSRIATLAPMLVATEPLRARGPLFATRCLRLIGASAVTLNDATQSVRAGFRGTELSRLWQSAGGVSVFEGRKSLFTQAFVGGRSPGTP